MIIFAHGLYYERPDYGRRMLATGHDCTTSPRDVYGYLLPISVDDLYGITPRMSISWRDIINALNSRADITVNSHRELAAPCRVDMMSRILTSKTFLHVVNWLILCSCCTQVYRQTMIRSATIAWRSIPAPEIKNIIRMLIMHSSYNASALSAACRIVHYLHSGHSCFWIASSRNDLNATNLIYWICRVLFLFHLHTMLELTFSCNLC